MSASRSRSRVSSTSRHMPGSRSVSYAQSVLPDGPVDQETAELFSELVHPHHEQEETLVDDEQEDLSRERQKLPWWKRPSPWWLMMATPFSTIAMSATIAPKIEIYTLLACSVHKPEIFKDRKILPASLLPSLLPRAEYQAEITFPPSFDIALNNDTSPPTDEPQPNPCGSDPVVLAAVARLTAFIATTMGVLGCLTTGWWGAYSDRYGRTRILGLTIFGLLMNDFNFILVTKYFRSLPGDGYWFLIVGPIIEGLLGGFGTASAASHAYMADVTSPAERSRIFSVFLGVVFTGIGLGPSIGGLLIQSTNNVLSVFYLAASIHGAYAILAFFFLPESLTKTQMQAAVVQYREQQRLLDEQEMTILTRIQRLFTFLKPLTIFFPEPIERSNPLKGPKWDWNLTLIALAYGFTVSIMGSLSYKFQYLIAVFKWSTAKVGYFLTVAGVTRALYLAVILPFTLKLVRSVLKRRRSRASPESDPLLSTSATSHSHEPHSASFDLWVARISLCIEVVAYTVMPFASTGLAFTGLTILSSFGGGFSPAVQSASLELYNRKLGGSAESGKLFGGLSVIQALAGQILGPSIYGFVFIRTVVVFPTAIFFVSVASVVISLICLSLVRLPADARTDLEEEVSHIPDHGVRDATLVEVDESGDLRGRKNASSAVPVVTVSAPSP
ncbi:major facilitator superfamily domain-containing protein [Mycena metata]|uniref:Major facilitator superfamily domain-containing protein n=1 Tax=Mycena metata TaxID=1033252 RepID=A0AAD7JZD9_9AGAR|nr:major facilitator superfamily domain-containing protein [Mycena metata]